MSILKEADFYYGAVLSTLINRGICPALVESGKDRQIYDFVTNKKEFRLFVKYRSKPINTKTPEYSSWQFHFSDDGKRELTLFMMKKQIPLHITWRLPGLLTIWGLTLSMIW